MSSESQYSICYSLERQLYMIIYRSKFVSSPEIAYNLIKNNQVCINGIVNNKPHTLVNIGDLISFKDNELINRFLKQTFFYKIFFTILSSLITKIPSRQRGYTNAKNYYTSKKIRKSPVK